jgi:SAM-dependent methyltransferase
LSAHDEYAPIAELYDHVDLYRNRADIDFYVGAAINAGGPVLELGCGTGRVLVPTARAGVAITGLDSSPSMLALCARKLSAEDERLRGRVELRLADMRHFEFKQGFALVTIPFRPFQHLLTVEDQLACLTSIRRHLTADGRVIVDLFNPSLDALATRPLGEETGEEPEFITPDGRRVIRRHRVVAHDRFAQVNEVELLYYVTHPDGRQERLAHAFHMRYLFRYELEHLLARAGFVLEQLYSDYDGSAFGSKYPGELIAVARRGNLP